MPDAEFCGDLEPHNPHSHTRLFKVLLCPGRQLPDAGKDTEETWVIGPTGNAVFKVGGAGESFYTRNMIESDRAITYLNALQQQLADVRQDNERLRQALEEIDQRVEELSKAVTGDGHERHWFWCCHAEYTIGEKNFHNEDCFIAGRGGLLDLTSAALTPSPVHEGQ